MGGEYFVEVDGMKIKTAVLEVKDCRGEFTMAAIERPNNGKIDKVVSEARIGRDREFGHAVVRGLSQECSFDVAQPGIDYVAPSVGSEIDFAIDSLETAIRYDGQNNGKNHDNKEK